MRKICILFSLSLGLVSGLSAVMTEAAVDARENHLRSTPRSHSLNRRSLDHLMPPSIEALDALSASSPSTSPSQSEAVEHELGPKNPSPANNKTVAIDAGPVGAEPMVSEMDAVQIAARLWSNASFPVEQFQAYTSPFGYRSSPTGGYRKEFHYGLDIAAPQQSYIRNWWTGVVTEVSDRGSCGTSVVIQSGEWTHMYCHMQGHVETSRGVPSLVDRDGGVQLWQGQEIAAGDRIGRVGMTGRTTGPHLHWGLKYQGHWVDPAWVLQAMAASHHALSGQ